MNSEKIFREFSNQLCTYSRSDEKVKAANQDVKYALELQKKRMESQNVRMEMDLNLRGEWMDKIMGKTISDSKYKNDLVWGWFQKHVTYYINNQKSLCIKENSILYVNITDVFNKDIDDTICCPHCGAILKVSELLENGCSYCQTHFIISDLFPKVTNYYFIKDYGMTQRESKQKIGKSVLLGVLFVLVLNSMNLTDYIKSGEYFMLIYSLIMSFLIGGFLGYFVLSISLFVGLFKDAIRSIPLVISQSKAKRKLPQIMKQYDPTFSFEYFTGKIQSLIKMIIFSDDISNIAVYTGDKVDSSLSRIVDASFAGGIGLEAYKIRDGYCYLDLKVYMNNIYNKNGKLKKSYDVYKMGVVKNTRHPVDYGFSVKKVSCKSCGASFDATKEKTCPYCHSQYHLKEDDWVVTYLRKI